MKETKTVKKAFAKEKVKGMFEKKTLQEAAGHNSGPPKQTYYCGSECGFKWKEISNDQVKETKKVKEQKVKGMLKNQSIRKQLDLDTIVDPPHIIQDHHRSIYKRIVFKKVMNNSK